MNADERGYFVRLPSDLLDTTLACHRIEKDPLHT